MSFTDDFLAVIFDLDGTVVDSNGVWEKIDSDYIKKRGKTLSEKEICDMASMSYDDVAKYLCSKGLDVTSDELKKEFHERAVYEYTNNIGLKPFVSEYLTYLKKAGKKIALATSSPKEFYEPVLKANNIYDFFDAFATTKEAGKEKDYPDVYLLACSKIGISPENSLAFEDTLKGILCAKKAGMKCIAVYDKYSEKDLSEIQKNSDGFIKNFSEMIQKA